MATEEYRGPDVSFVEAQEKSAYDIRVSYYKDYSELKQLLDRKFNVDALAREVERLKRTKKATQEQIRAAEDNLLKAQQEAAKKIQEISETRFKNEYKTWTVYQRKTFQEQVTSAALLKQRQLEDELELIKVKEANQEQLSDKEKDLLAHSRKYRNAVAREVAASRKKEFELAQQTINAENKFYQDRKQTYKAFEKSEQALADIRKQKEDLELKISAFPEGKAPKELQDLLTHLTKQEELYADNTAALKKSAQKEKAQDAIKEQLEENKTKQEEGNAALKAKFGTKEGLKQTGLEAAGKALAKATEALSAGLNQINSKIESFYSLQAKMEARLQGATLDGKQLEYSRMLKNISQSIGLSGLVRQDKVVEKLQTLVDQGVAYNAESRAFLGTIAENVASTFDATNPDLLRLIRLQQADTTAARLGLEASLTRLFNQYFSDTSYLAQAFDSVSASLIDVSSMLSRDDSLAFEYNVQKWLGALSSLGLSESAATTISQGLNYLGTGNVTALNGSSTLQTLFAMSAGSSYADILTKGLNANSTNDLLRNMIMYLKSIADNTNENLVVKSAYAELLGISVADLSAIANITQTEIDNLHKKTLTYEEAYKETQDQLNKVSSRIHFSQMVSNSIDNALTTAATGIGGTPAIYGMWKAANIIEDLTGGIAIPFISAFGTGVDLNTTVMQLLKTGIAGGSLLGQLIGSLANGRAGGAMNLDSWKIQSYTSRGQGRKVLDIGAMTGVSQSGSFDFAGSSSGSDITNSSMAGAAEDAEETGKITNKSQEGKADFIEKIYKAIGEDKSSNIIDLLGSINNEVKSITSSSGGNVLSRLVSASSFTTDLSSIQETYFSTVGADISNNNQAGLGVVVNGLSADTKDYFDHTIKAILATMLAGETTVDGALETGGLVEAIKTAMSSVTMPVRVTNDYFDENQQQQAFGGIS